MSVRISDIFQYVGKRVRPLREGEAVFFAGHVVRCGMLNEESILQSSGIKDKPHTVTIHFISKNTHEWNCKCTCKAGEGAFCKHIIATLLYANK